LTFLLIIVGLVSGAPRSLVCSRFQERAPRIFGMAEVRSRNIETYNSDTEADSI